MLCSNISVPKPATSAATSVTVKVRLSDDSEVRRFTFTGTSFADLSAVVRQIFSIAPTENPLLKYKDDEGDLISVNSDAELQEALKFAAGNLLNLVLHKAAGSSANVQTPAPAPACRSHPMPAATPAATPTPGAPVIPARPKGRGPWVAENGGKWKEEKQRLLARFKDEKVKLHSAMKELKQSNSADKGKLKAQVCELKSQLKEHKQELKRMPREFIMAGRFVSDVSLPDGTEVLPGAKVVKTWRFRNESNRAWPEGTQLVWVGKKCDRLGAPDSIAVPIAQPGQEVDISVPLCLPDAPGRYTAYFRLSGPLGRKFGQRVWVMLNVVGDSSGDEKSADNKCGEKVTAGNVSNDDLVKYASHLKALNEMGYVDTAVNVRLLKRFDGNLEKAVNRLIKRQQLKAGAWKNA
jgi:hypothetical protein